MKKTAIARAWKDPIFRASLTDAEREALPEHPAGTSMTELSDDELSTVVGGLDKQHGRSKALSGSCGMICTATVECWSLCN